MDNVLLTFGFVTFIFIIIALLIGASIIYNQFQKKEDKLINDIAAKVNDSFLSSAAFDTNTKNIISNISQETKYLDANLKKQKEIIDDIDQKTLSLSLKYQVFEKNNDEKMNKIKEAVDGLPFEAQLAKVKEINDLSLKNETQMAKITNSDIVQDSQIVSLNKSYSDINRDLSIVDSEFKIIQNNYVPKAIMDKDYVSGQYFEQGIIDLNKALQDLENYIKNLPFDYKTTQDISNLNNKNNTILAQLNSLSTSLIVIEKDYIKKEDVTKAIADQQGALNIILESLSRLNSNVERMRSIVDQMPSMYVNNDEFEVIRKISTLISSSIMKVVNSSTINFDGTVGVNTNTPQAKFHVYENQDNWAAKIQNNTTVVNLAHRNGNGLHINMQQPSDINKYGIQIENSKNIIFKTSTNGVTTVKGTATAPIFKARNQICIDDICLTEQDLINLRGFQPTS